MKPFIAILIFCGALAAQTQTVPCVRKIFLTGRQDYALAWAKKNLARKTCMVPVDSMDQAEAILDLEPDPDLYPRLPDIPRSSDDGFWVTCSGSVGSTHCTDSNGKALDVDCSEDRHGVVSCYSSYGPDLGVEIAHATGRGGYALMYHLLLRNTAHAFLYDKDRHLLWKFTGRKPWEIALSQGMGCLRGSHMNGWPYNKLGNKGKSDVCSTPAVTGTN